MSIQLESVLIILGERRILIFLAKQTIADGKHLDTGAHEAMEGVLRGTNDRLAADIKGGVDENRTPRAAVESGE